MDNLKNKKIQEVAFLVVDATAGSGSSLFSIRRQVIIL
jgi:hypothetical protein